jgi:hypothetical protein
MKKISKNTDIDTVKWVWAIGEQLHLLDSFDAHYIDEAASGWASVDVYQDFIRKYALTRGKLGKFLKENPKPVMRICNKYFLPKLSKGFGPDEIKARWHGATGELTHHKNNSESIQPYSFTKKMFWFFHPQKLTMYDRYVCAALAGEYGVKITPENYLEYFYRFYNDVAEGKIENAMAYHYRNYPYKYRIADKYLWLKGSAFSDQEKERTARTLMSAHNKTPLNTRAV